MRHLALTDACRSCAEACARCDIPTASCQACRAACETVEALAAVDGILFIQALRLCIGICDWCAEQCNQQAGGDYQTCAEACRACRDQCQTELSDQVSEMIQQG